MLVLRSKKLPFSGWYFGNQEPAFTVGDKKIYVSGATSSTQDIVKLLKQLESGFKRIINLNKYQSKRTNHAQNRYLDCLVNPVLQVVNILLVLSFEKLFEKVASVNFFKLPKQKITFLWLTEEILDQPLNNDTRTHDNVWNISVCQAPH